MAQNQTRRVAGAVIVTRVSTGEQAKHGTSLESQLDLCRAKAAALGLVVVAEYQDAGVSGALLLRAGMQAALSDVRAGRAGTLITATISRYSRDVEHQQRIKKEVRAAGGRVVFCDMDFDDTPEGDLAFDIFGGFAAYERRMFRDRSMKGHRKRVEAGVQTKRSLTPYGYLIPTKASVLRGDHPAEQLGKYLIMEQHAPVVRRIFADYASGGMSLSALTRALNEEGVPTPKGGQLWIVASLRCILKNPVYKGKPAFGKTHRLVDEARLSLTHHATGEPLTTPRFDVHVPPDEWLTLDAPALVSEAVWDQAQERLAASQARFGGNPRRVWMLSGRVHCAECGARMRFMPASAKRPGRGAFACGRDRNHYEATGHRVCSHARYPIDDAENAVGMALESACSRPEVIREAIDVYRRGGDTVPGQDVREQLRSIEMEIEELNAREAAAVPAQIAGVRAGASPEAYARVFADIAARRKELEDQRGRLTAQARRRKGAPAEDHGAAGDAEAAGRALADLRRMLAAPDLPGSKKREMLSGIIEKVVCRKEGIEVCFAPGLFDGDFQADTLHGTRVPSRTTPTGSSRSTALRPPTWSPCGCVTTKTSMRLMPS